MPPWSSHHLIMAFMASLSSWFRPGDWAKPASSPYPIVICLSATPCSVAPLASPFPQGEATSPNIVAFGWVVLVAAAVVVAAAELAAEDAVVAVVVAVVVGGAAVVPADVSSLRLPLHAAATVASATTTTPHRSVALRMITLLQRRRQDGAAFDGRPGSRARAARGCWPPVRVRRPSSPRAGQL